MTSNLETQIRDFAEGVSAAGPVVTLDDVLEERLGEGSVHVLRPRQARRRSLVGLVAAAVIVTLVAVGLLASRTRSDTTVPPATQPAPTLPAATTVPPSTPEPVITGVDGGSAIDAGWRWVSLDERLAVFGPLSNGLFLGELADGRLAAMYPERIPEGVPGEGSCCFFLVSGDNGEWVEHRVDDLGGAPLAGIAARAGLIWVQTRPDGETPSRLWVSADGETWQQSVPIESASARPLRASVAAEDEFHFVRAPDGSILYTDVEFGLWRSVDEGVTFESVAPAGAPGRVVNLWVDSEGVKVRMGAARELSVSQDGLTWLDAGGPSDGPLIRIGSSSHTPDPLVVEAPDGTLVALEARDLAAQSRDLHLSFSEDGGRTWQERQVRLPFEGPAVASAAAGWLRIHAVGVTDDVDHWVTRDGITWYSFAAAHLDWGPGSSGAILDPATHSVAVPPAP